LLPVELTGGSSLDGRLWECPQLFPLGAPGAVRAEIRVERGRYRVQVVRPGFGDLEMPLSEGANGRSTKLGATGSLYGPYSLAFTASGDLWVENFDNNTTVEFGRDQLSTSGSPVPLRAIVGPKTGMNSPSYVVIEP